MNPAVYITRQQYNIPKRTSHLILHCCSPYIILNSVHRGLWTFSLLYMVNHAWFQCLSLEYSLIMFLHNLLLQGSSSCSFITCHNYMRWSTLSFWLGDWFRRDIFKGLDCFGILFWGYMNCKSSKIFQIYPLYMAIQTVRFFYLCPQVFYTCLWKMVLYLQGSCYFEGCFCVGHLFLMLCIWFAT